MMMTNWRNVLAWRELVEYEDVLNRFESEVYNAVREKIPSATQERVLDLIKDAVGWPAYEDKDAVASTIISYVYGGWNNLVNETVNIIVETLERR